MKFTTLLTLIILTFNGILALRQNKCYLLAMEGGGTKGAYQAGAFKAFADLLPPEEVLYDVVTGVSVGSLNGLLIAAYEKGKEKIASEQLTHVWETIQSDDILLWWPYLGPVRGLFDKPSFFDNSPLQPYLERELMKLGGELKRKFTLGIVDAQTGDYIVIDEKAGAMKMPYYVKASASVPGIFPYIVDGDKIYVDGGTTDNLNLKAGIVKCREIVGDDDSAITVDVMLTNPFKPVFYDMSQKTTADLYFRADDLKGQAEAMWYLNNTIRAHPEINWRYIVIPKEALPNYPVIALSFDRKSLKEEHDIGYKDAKEAISFHAPNMKEIFKQMKPLRRVRLT